KRAGIVKAQIHQSRSWSRYQHERRIGDVTIDDRPEVTKGHVAASRRKSRIDDVRKHHSADIMIVAVTHLVSDAAVAVGRRFPHHREIAARKSKLASPRRGVAV